MNSNIARILGCTLLASGLGIGMAGAQTPATGAALLPPDATKAFPMPSKPKPPFDIPIVLFGIAPPHKDPFPVPALFPAVFFAGTKLGTLPVFGGTRPPPKAEMVERGGYDR